MSFKINRGNRLTFLRKNVGMSQAELAKLSGVSDAAISLIENNKRGQSLDIAIALCKVIGVSMDVYVGLKSSDNYELLTEIAHLKSKIKKAQSELK